MRLDDLSAFVPGAVGSPGKRVFHLQAQRGSAYMTVRCEKQHVSALCEYFSDQLADLPTPPPEAVPDPSFSAPEAIEFIAGSLGVGNDRERGTFAVILHDIDDDSDATLQLDVEHGLAVAFVTLAEELLGAGRPPCQFCSAPIDPSGHACPRMN